MLKAFTVAAAICITASFAVNAASLPEETFVDAFLGNCVLNLPNLEKIRAASRLFGWKALPRDAMTAIGPLDPDAQLEGWTANAGEVRHFIGISTGSIGQRRAVACTMANPELKQDVLLADLQKKLTIKMLNEESEAGQRYRSWTTSVNGYSVLIMLTTMQNERVAGGTLAAAVKQASGH
jgi:hypothetical protein